ncbi:MAG: nitronate monooxygenase family protein [Burkholderiaceae bacterium]
MKLARLLGIDLPIVQAPMAGVQASRLAIAVSQAGGLGSLPCAMLSGAAIGDEIRSIRNATDRPFNLNFFCHAVPAFDAARDARWRESLAAAHAELGIDTGAIGTGAGRNPFDSAGADIVESLRPPVVSFHFGLPEPGLLGRVKASGAIVMASATTVAEARWLEANGADVVIAQGLEAGGHRGHFLSMDLTEQLGLFALLPQVVAAVKVPVIAAGGIADAAGVRAALALGAAGIQAGTAFLRTPEADTSELHRAALASDAARHTALTNLFTGRPARGIVNRYLREHGPMSELAPEFPLASAASAPLRAAAEKRGSPDFSPLWSGQNPGGARPVPAADIVRGLAAGIVS